MDAVLAISSNLSPLVAQSSSSTTSKPCLPPGSRGFSSCRRSRSRLWPSTSGGGGGGGSAFVAVARNASVITNLQNNGVYTVGDFMTKKEDLYTVKTTTSVDEALQMLEENRITGFPVIDDDWKLVGVVSDYDLLALDSISGSGRSDTSSFPDVDSTWKTFNEIQKLLSKTNGKVIGELIHLLHSLSVKQLTSKMLLGYYLKQNTIGFL